MDALAVKVRRVRRAKRWTQTDLARAAGVHLATISGFERRAYAPQPEDLRAILAALGIEDETGDDVPAEAREEWPADVKVFLDDMGLFLTAYPPTEREQLMRVISRQVVGR